MSTLFYELKKYRFECIDKELNMHLLINHDEHVRIYQQIAKKYRRRYKPIIVGK